jgi:hypothetical protein
MSTTADSLWRWAHRMYVNVGMNVRMGYDTRLP